MVRGDAGDLPGLGPWRRGEVAEFAPFPDAAVDGSIPARFFETADRHSGTVALRSPAGSWTYGELATDVRHLAVRLLNRRQGPGTGTVAVLAGHDGPLVVAMLGVIAAGRIVVVLDPAAPPTQTAAVVAESAPELLLTDEANAEAAAALAAASGAPVERIEALAGSGAPPSVQLPHLTPADSLMLAFTSGTSGTPKGADITHGVLLNLVRGATNALGICPEDRMPMLFPVSLAVAAYPMFLPLLNGGTLSTLDVRSVGLEPVAPFLEAERITVAYMAPTVIRFLVDALAGRTFPDMRMVALGGEMVTREVVQIARDLFSPGHVANGFGTTETGVVALYVIGADDPVPDVVPAGHPVPDVELVILDDSGTPLEGAGSGEVGVVSPHNFRGYWGHPGATGQVLTQDPSGREGWSMYRTGDIGSIDPRSGLLLAGRVDTRVKVRGRFVVLGDVEDALQQLDEIADAAVVADRDDGVVSLTAHVVAAPGADLDPTRARARLLEHREAYSVPSRWVLHDELPRLPNGKLNRRALPGPEVLGGPREPLEGPSVASLTGQQELHRVVADIWRRLLPVQEVGLDEDFAHLGGDSLLAAQMVIAVEHEVGVVVPMGELVHARTVRDLSEVIARLSEPGTPGSSTVSVVQRGDTSKRPRLWFVPDLQGSAYRLRHLAAALGPDQPLWSFESPFLKGDPNPFHRLDTFAARLLTDLRALQPEGPYWLAGYSFGGICAYEMARQLRRDGEEVAFLALIDVGPAYRGPGWRAHRSPPRPWFGVAPSPPPGSPLTARVAHYREMARGGPRRVLRHLMVRSGLVRLVDPIRFRLDLRWRGSVRPEWRLWYAWEEHWKLAATAWDRTSPYEGRMHLLWASDSASGDASMGWGRLVDDLRITRFDGDHDSLLEPRCAPSLGSALRGVIDVELDRYARRDGP